MQFPYPEAGGISQPQRAAGEQLPFTTEKHTGSGIEPGFSDCEATVLPRRHCAPQLINCMIIICRFSDTTTSINDVLPQLYCFYYFYGVQYLRHETMYPSGFLGCRTE